jgi:hypothetical protein
MNQPFAWSMALFNGNLLRLSFSIEEMSTEKARRLDIESPAQVSIFDCKGMLLPSAPSSVPNIHVEAKSYKFFLCE